MNGGGICAAAMSGEANMRQTQIANASALIFTILAILGVTVINANPSKQAVTAPASSSFDVMQMMKDSKDLPVQQFDSH